MALLVVWAALAGLLPAVSGMNQAACIGDASVKLVFDLNGTDPLSIEEVTWSFYPPSKNVAKLAAGTNNFVATEGFANRVTSGGDVVNLVLWKLMAADNGIYSIQVLQRGDLEPTSLENITLEVFECSFRTSVCLGANSTSLAFSGTGAGLPAILVVEECEWRFHPSYGSPVRLAVYIGQLVVSRDYTGRLTSVSASGPGFVDLQLSQPTPSDSGVYGCSLKERGRPGRRLGYWALWVTPCPDESPRRCSFGLALILLQAGVVVVSLAYAEIYLLFPDSLQARNCLGFPSRDVGLLGLTATVFTLTTVTAGVCFGVCRDFQQDATLFVSALIFITFGVGAAIIGVVLYVICRDTMPKETRPVAG